MPSYHRTPSFLSDAPMINTDSMIELPVQDREQESASCSSELDKAPWSFSAEEVGYGPGASRWDTLPDHAPVQSPIPATYRSASQEELDRRIKKAKVTLGDSLVILGHYYQRDDIVKHADYLGDSYNLSLAALEHKEVSSIVFCGVHFMAETADILSRPDQKVFLPNVEAGCSMADMADTDSIDACWDALTSYYRNDQDEEGKVSIIPVTYMNSSAELKAFCGRNGGIVCTSSNAERVLEWVFRRGKRVLFFPDQHLGRNTGAAMGLTHRQMPVWHRSRPLSGIAPEQLDDARMILWEGFCSVHTRFNVSQIEKARRDYPGARIIVHPECPNDVVQAADASGSTEFIRKTVENASEPTTFGIGTEINMVNRLAADHPQHTIFCLDPVVCPCSTMYRIHPSYLAWVLEEIVEGRSPNRIQVREELVAPARLSLERMIEATSA